jgi:hypothetical protein
MKYKIIAYLQLFVVFKTYAGDNIGRGGSDGLYDFFAVLCIIGLVVFGVLLIIAKLGGNKDD